MDPADIRQRANAKSSPETFSGVVTLRKRVSKNVYDLDTVRMMPHPPLKVESAAMCKHYLATYALFRVSMVSLPSSTSPTTLSPPSPTTYPHTPRPPPPLQH